MATSPGERGKIYEVPSILHHCPVAFPPDIAAGPEETGRFNCPTEDYVRLFHENYGNGNKVANLINIAEEFPYVYLTLLNGGSLLETLPTDEVPEMSPEKARYINTVFHIGAVINGGGDALWNSVILKTAAQMPNSQYALGLQEIRNIFEDDGIDIKIKSERLAAKYSDDPAMLSLYLLDRISRYYSNQKFDGEEISKLEEVAKVALGANFGTSDTEFEKTTMTTSIDKMISYINDLSMSYHYPQLFKLCDEQIEQYTKLPFALRYNSLVLNELIVKGLDAAGVSLFKPDALKNRHSVHASIKPVRSLAAKVLKGLDFIDPSLGFFDRLKKMEDMLAKEIKEPGSENDNIENFKRVLQSHDIVRARIFCRDIDSPAEDRNDSLITQELLEELFKKGVINGQINLRIFDIDRTKASHFKTRSNEVYSQEDIKTVIRKQKELYIHTNGGIRYGLILTQGHVARTMSLGASTGTLIPMEFQIFPQDEEQALYWGLQDKREKEEV